jgi:hypothetical protein
MDRYKAVTEYLFDWRTEREPSCEDMVFWRETGMKDEDEDVDARDGACSMETAMARSWALGRGGRAVGVVEKCGSRLRGGVIGATRNQGSGTCVTTSQTLVRVLLCPSRNLGGRTR